MEKKIEQEIERILLAAEFDGANIQLDNHEYIKGLLLKLYSDPPSPEPPEKVSSLLLTEKEIDGAFKAYPQLKPCGTTLYCCIMDILRAQILKLQQAGWGKLKEAKQYQAVFDELNFDRERKRFWEEIAEADEKIKEQEARIKELEAKNERLTERLRTLLNDGV